MLYCTGVRAILTNRYRCTYANVVTSDMLPITFGVSQRSVRRFGTDAAYKQAHVLNCMYCRNSNVQLLNRREIRTRAHDGPLLDITIHLLEAYKRSIGYFEEVRWNELPHNIHKTNTYLEFKQLQKKEMLLPIAKIKIIR